MLRTNDTVSGTCVLVNDRTGEMTGVAVFIAPHDDGTVTYTAQAIDRSVQETVTWSLQEAEWFREMMNLVRRVAQGSPV